MIEIWHGLVRAIELIISLDPEVVEISLRSLQISLASTLIASLICIPLAGAIHLYRFPGKKAFISVVQTLYSMPTVVVGLFIFVVFSAAGPLGFFGIMFTPTLMVIGQVVLISPIVLGLTISALSGVDKKLVDTALSLGASGWQTALVVLREARFAVLAGVIMAFGRAISEVGLVMMVGGNIRGFTRVITTAIALETSRGELELAMALGILLLAIALVVVAALNIVQQRSS